MNKIIYKLYKLALCTLLLIMLTNVWVEYTASNYLYNTTNEIPYNKVGVVLGTSKYLVNGQENLFYKYRIAAAVKLYKSVKIKYIFGKQKIIYVFNANRCVLFCDWYLNCKIFY